MPAHTDKAKIKIKIRMNLHGLVSIEGIDNCVEIDEVRGGGGLEEVRKGACGPLNVAGNCSLSGRKLACFPLSPCESRWNPKTPPPPPLQAPKDVKMEDASAPAAAEATPAAPADAAAPMDTDAPATPATEPAKTAAEKKKKVKKQDVPCKASEVWGDVCRGGGGVKKQNLGCKVGRATTREVCKGPPRHPSLPAPCA